MYTCAWCDQQIPETAIMVSSNRGVRVFVEGGRAHQVGHRKKRKLSPQEKTNNWRRLEEIEEDSDVIAVAA